MLLTGFTGYRWEIRVETSRFAKPSLSAYKLIQDGNRRPIYFGQTKTSTILSSIPAGRGVRRGWELGADSALEDIA
jgi:hypothetical protein